MLAQAEQWQRLLGVGDMKSRAEIARRAGVSAMRVTQILALLRLPEEMKERIRHLPPGTPERLVTERGLRRLAKGFSAPPRSARRA